jgi:SAM-dependent methyltransferase
METTPAYHRHLITHADHPIAAPLAEASVRKLLARALCERPDTAGPGPRVLDLGCGAGAWLLRALATGPGVRAVGVDTSVEVLARAERAAVRLGVADRLELHAMDAREYADAGPFDVVLCVGATHAFGGPLPALEAARERLAPGGRVLIGEGFWERAPDETALRALGGADRDDYADLASTVDRITAGGWTPVYGHTSTLEEWDDYEWSWTGSLSGWALDHPGHHSAAEARTTAAGHRAGWLRGYRGVLGFVTLLLRPAPQA